MVFATNMPTSLPLLIHSFDSFTNHKLQAISVIYTPNCVINVFRGQLNWYNTIQYLFAIYDIYTWKKKWRKLMTENKWRENLKETTRLITSQAFSLKITNLILELQYGQYLIICKLPSSLLLTTPLIFVIVARLRFASKPDCNNSCTLPTFQILFYNYELPTSCSWLHSWSVLSDLVSWNFLQISFSSFSQYFFVSSFTRRILTPISVLLKNGKKVLFWVF